MSAFPAAEAATSCAFDDGAVSAAQLAEFVVQAKVQAGVQGGADFDEVEVQQWVVCDVGAKHFGKEVPDEVLADGQRFAWLGSLGIVDWPGAKRFVERVAADKVDN